MNTIPLTGALSQSQWRAKCLECAWRSREPSASLTAPRHSRETGHEVTLEILLSGRFKRGLPL